MTNETRARGTAPAPSQRSVPAVAGDAVHSGAVTALRLHNDIKERLPCSW